MTKAAKSNPTATGWSSWFGLPGEARRMTSTAVRPNLSDIGLNTRVNDETEPIARANLSVGSIPTQISSVKNAAAVLDYYRMKLFSQLRLLNLENGLYDPAKILASAVRFGKKFMQKGLDVANSVFGFDDGFKDPGCHQPFLSFKGYNVFSRGTLLRYNSLEINSSESGPQFRLKLKVDNQHWSSLLGTSKASTNTCWCDKEEKNKMFWRLNYDEGFGQTAYIGIFPPPAGCIEGSITVTKSSDKNFLIIEIL